MAIKRLTIDGYGQVELNNCAFRRDGRIEAQCKAAAATGEYFATNKVENGMILAVDNVARKVTVPTDNSLPVALNYSSEHIYDERTPGLKNFALNGKDDFYPRLGYLAVGDKFTTNCVSYDTTSTGMSDDAAFKATVGSYATTALYGTTCSNGSILVSTTAPTEGLKLRVIKSTTMPDGQFGVKFQVYNA